MDVHNKGYLDSDTLLTAFKQNKIYCDDKSLKCLMKMFFAGLASREMNWLWVLMRFELLTITRIRSAVKMKLTAMMIERSKTEFLII